MPQHCTTVYIGLSLTSLALLISLCLNILLYLLRRKDRQNKEQTFYQDFLQSNRFENEEEELNQDNPIYGNIHVDGAGTLRIAEYDCYERMTKQCKRQDEKAEPTDISYASLDLNVNQKRKKKRNQEHQAQTHSQPMAHQNSPEMGAGDDAGLSSCKNSLMASRHSIYLNSHQVALEAEERERERMRERKHNREREMETMNSHGDFELGFDQSDPSYE